MCLLFLHYAKIQINLYNSKILEKRFGNKKKIARDSRTILFQFDDVAPACGGILAFEVVLDGIGKNISSTFTTRFRILLRAKHNSL